MGYRDLPRLGATESAELFGDSREHRRTRSCENVYRSEGTGEMDVDLQHAVVGVDVRIS